MAARAMWKGILAIDGADELPVKLYAAVQSHDIQFNLLEPTGKRRVRQRMVDPKTKKAYEHEEITRGAERNGRIVMLDDMELKALEPKESRTIELLRFVEPERIPSARFDRPYYLGPDGDADAYFAFASALERLGRVGVARWTMRKKGYIGAVEPFEGYVMLNTLRAADEVVDASGLATQGRELDEKERRLARSFIEALTGEFEPEQYQDRYRDALQEMIEAKASGKKIKLSKYEEPEEQDEDLAASLEASLAALKEAS